MDEKRNLEFITTILERTGIAFQIGMITEEEMNKVVEINDDELMAVRLLEILKSKNDHE